MRTLRRAAAPLAVLLLACGSGGDSARPSPPASSPGPVPASRTAVPSATPSVSPTPRLLAGTPRLRLVARFDSPLYVVSPPGDPRLFVVEQAGRVKIVRGGRVLPRPFLDIRDEVRSGGEQGLLSIAFSPDYRTERRFYVDYTDRAGDTRVVEYAASASDPDVADEGSRRELLRVDQPYANHNGGLLLFDPAGMLVVGLGDGGSGGDPENRAQDLGTHLGKLLRIDPRPSGGRPYGVPPDNPFLRRSGARPEIWAYGLRNPWRFSFDRASGDLYLADVGQNQVEEVDVVPPGAQSGANYGWPAFEGDRRFKGGSVDTSRLVRPLVVYRHSGGRCSITGGIVYRGPVAALRGRYLYGDACTGEVWSIPAGASGAPAPRLEPVAGGRLASFGEDAAGDGYVVSLAGEVWQITA